MMGEFSVRSFSSLPDLLAPLHYDNLKPIPPTDPGDYKVPKTLTYRANISKDAKWSYVYNGSVLRCFPVSLQESTLASKWSPSSHNTFVLNTSAYQFPNSVITCAAELAVHCSRRNGVTKLLLGLNCGSDGGALVVFDPIRGKPIKRISIPAPVSSVLVLSNYEEFGYTRPFFSEAMVAMVGIAAVGLYGGQSLIVDLGLDDPELRSVTLTMHPSKVFKLMFVEPHEDFIASKRRTAASKDLLICLDFRNQEFAERFNDYEPNSFYYNSGDELVKLSRDTVSVTCMEYIPTTGSLAVGFNFGGFQIWRVDNFSLEFTASISATNITGIPVHSFCVQLPVDDPKNFCYLWVLYGTPVLEMQVARAVFYALLYEQKEETDQFGTVYKNLQTCLQRLSFDLQDFYATSDESGLENSLQEENLLDANSLQRYIARPIRMWNQNENLVFFLWECNTEEAYTIGIFDLNQWYSAQTPAKIVCGQDLQLNPFWSAISINIPFTPVRPGSPCLQLYDLQVISKTLERWENPHLRQDVHLFPASLTFQAICLSNMGTFTFEYFGVQEKLLRLIQKEGYQMLTEPNILKQLCESFGLSPFLTYNVEEDISEYDAHRFYIFSALLESRRPSLIIQIANHWVDGSFANLDCTIDFILRWIKGYNYTVRMHVETHWETLMTQCSDLPPETVHCLNYSNFVWNQINGLLMTLVRHDQVYESAERNEEIECLQYALDRLVPYSAALLMLHRAGVLPVKPDFDVMGVLKSACRERRSVVKTAITNCSFLEPEHKTEVPYLLIDSLMQVFRESFIEAEWHVKEDGFLYPPEHPMDIFNMLMGNWVDFESKLASRVIFYFILDVTNLLDMAEVAEAHSTLRGDFSSILNLSPDEQNAVLQLWLIDHGQFEKPLLYLCNGERLKDLDVLPWAEACTLLTAQGCEVPVLHILNHFCFPNAGILYVNLLCENPATMAESLEGVLTSGLFCNDENMLSYCFTVAKDKGFLDHFISTRSRHSPLPIQESLARYIKQLPQSFTNDYRLLQFLMMRKDDKNAESHFEKMKISWRDLKSLTRIETEQWENAQLEMKGFLASCRDNFILNFLGYEPGHPSARKQPPLELPAKVVPPTPSTPMPSTKLKKFIADEIKNELPQQSPLRIYKSYAARKSAEHSLTRKSRVSESKGVTDLSVLLKTPKIDHRGESVVHEEEIFSTPKGVHGILKGPASKMHIPPNHTPILKASTPDSKSRLQTPRDTRTPSPRTRDTQTSSPNTRHIRTPSPKRKDIRTPSPREEDMELNQRRVTRSQSKKLGLDMNETLLDLSSSIPSARTTGRRSRAKSEEPDRRRRSVVREEDIFSTPKGSHGIILKGPDSKMHIPPNHTPILKASTPDSKSRLETPRDTRTPSPRTKDTQTSSPNTRHIRTPSPKRKDIRTPSPRDEDMELNQRRVTRRQSKKLGLDMNETLLDLSSSIPSARTTRRRSRAISEEPDRRRRSVVHEEDIFSTPKGSHGSLKGPDSKMHIAGGTRKKETVFGYAPGLSCVEENSNSPACSLTNIQLEKAEPEASILFATIHEEEEERPRKRRCKKELFESSLDDEKADAKSTSSKKSGKSGKSTSSSRKRITRSSSKTSNN